MSRIKRHKTNSAGIEDTVEKLVQSLNLVLEHQELLIKYIQEGKNHVRKKTAQGKKAVCVYKMGQLLSVMGFKRELRKRVFDMKSVGRIAINCY